MVLNVPKLRWVTWGLPWLPAVTMMLVLGACTGPVAPLVEAPLAPSRGQSAAREPGSPETLAAAHKASPGDATTALAYAKALRTGGAKAEALAVLETAAKTKPGDRRLALDRGLLALELGESAKADTLLRAAHDPKTPDWRLHSALGAALASCGRQPEAQAQFAKALALAPNHPSILNNLALSYALEGKAVEAEKVLRTASTAKGTADDRRVRQNLALVLGLGGKYAEARSVAETALPAEKANSNVAYLQKLAQARGGAPPEPEAPPKAASAGAPPTYRLGARPAAE